MASETCVTQCIVADSEYVMYKHVCMGETSGHSDEHLWAGFIVVKLMPMFMEEIPQGFCVFTWPDVPQCPTLRSFCPASLVLSAASVE